MGHAKYFITTRERRTDSQHRLSNRKPRRTIYGLLYALSLFGLLVGASIIAVVIQITYKSLSEISNGAKEHYWTDNWLLVDIGLLLAGLVVLIVSSIAAGKFKREGDSDVTELLTR